LQAFYAEMGALLGTRRVFEPKKKKKQTNKTFGSGKFFFLAISRQSVRNAKQYGDLKA